MKINSLLRNALHPILALPFGYKLISMMGGFNFQLIFVLIVAAIWAGLLTGICGTFYEMFEKKYAEATPSSGDILSTAIGGALGGILNRLSPNINIMDYYFFIALGLVLLDATLIVIAFNKKKKLKK